MTTQILRLSQVQARTGLSRSGVYARLTTGTFPKPIKIGLRAIGFIEAEIEEYLTAQIAASRAA